MSDSPLLETPGESGPPRRIAFCITDLDVGGAERCLVNLACELPQSDWSPHVYCLSRRGVLADQLEAHGIPATCLNWRGWSDAPRIWRLARLLREWRPELLQTFLFHGNMAGRIAARFARVPVVVSGIRVAEREKSWHVRLERMTRRLVTHHVCVSASVAEFSIREARLRPETVTVIPNGVDAARFAGALPLAAEELEAPPGSRWIIAIGRLHPQKGHALLIDAVAPVLRTNPDWRMMIVGEGPLRRELESQIASLECGDRIRLLGFRDDVPRLLKSASLFVLPSLWEGQPNVVLEALAAGLPVIATDVEGVRELIDPAAGGRLVSPGDVSALRESISEFVSSAPSRTGDTHKAQSFSPQLFTTHNMARRYADLYRRLLQSEHC